MDTIKVMVTNTSALVVNNTTVFYQLNGGTIYSTVIGTVAANTIIPFLLTHRQIFLHRVRINLKSGHIVQMMIFILMIPHKSRSCIRHLCDTYPYTEGFEQGNGGWVSGGINSTWMYGVPGKQIIARAAEGNNVWTTSLNGTYNADEISYLYSPCFDLHGLVQPYLSFGLHVSTRSRV